MHLIKCQNFINNLIVEHQSVFYGASFFVVCLAAIVCVNIYILNVRKQTRRAKEKEYHDRELEKKLSIFKSASQAEEEERERIARNLHDEINLMLAVHKQVLEKHAFNIENGKFVLDEYYEEIGNIEMIREAVTACANNLVPAFLLKNGLFATLQDHVRHINQGGKLKAKCNVFVNEKISKYFNKQDELNIYRICLELLNNVMKHARPNSLTITISMQKKSLLIQIDHDGQKTTTEKIERIIHSNQGLGLKSIKSRMLIQKAKVTYSDDKNGPAISCVIPSSELSYN
ncbi:hypothetical protein CNR22_18410 [Sphingobacteriaceae bacterium]|nr:hypothetical protein CNR22_18410 [Sphingobacteriaceae bacterium]